MGTTKTINAGVKLGESLHARLQTLSLAKDRISHWLMKTAIEEYVAREERYEREKVEDMERWEAISSPGRRYPTMTLRRGSHPGVASTNSRVQSSLASRSAGGYRPASTLS